MLGPKSSVCRELRVRTFAALILAALVVASCVAPTAVEEDEAVESASTSSQDESGQSAQSATAAEPTEPAVAEAAAPVGDLAFDALVPVVFSSFGDADGSVWNVRVSAPRDVTAAVLGANQFNDAPPDGVVFAGFDVEMTLVEAGKEPLSPGFNFSWEILGGASAAVYDLTTIPDVLGCGVTDGEFNDYAEVFVGGSLAGLVCVPLPVEDLGAPGTRVAMNFSGGERTIFGQS